MKKKSGQLADSQAQVFIQLLIGSAVPQSFPGAGNIARLVKRRGITLRHLPVEEQQKISAAGFHGIQGDLPGFGLQKELLYPTAALLCFAGGQESGQIFFLVPEHIVDMAGNAVFEKKHSRILLSYKRRAAFFLAVRQLIQGKFPCAYPK